MNLAKGSLRAFALAVIAIAPVRIVLADSNPTHLEASIPFANRGGIRDWSADGDRGLWVQAASRKWYYARFMGRCTGLAFATALGFDTRSLSSFDRWSSVVVPGYSRCALSSLTPSDGPPRKRRAGADRATEPAAATQPPQAQSAEEANLQMITLHAVTDVSETTVD
jgi:Family of unknown function (DUF6491)